LQQEFGDHAVRAIARQIVPLRPDDRGVVAYQRFNEDADCLLLAVVDEQGRPCGIVERNEYLTLFASQYGRAVYENRPIRLIMDANPLIVEASTPSSDFAKDSMALFSDKLKKGFVVTEDGRYHAVGTIIDLLKSSIADRARSTRMLQDMVHLDALTNLASRRRLNEHLDTLLACPERPVEGEGPAQTALLAIDLDRFKLVNDTFGHAMGDRVLRSVAQRIRGVVRPSDLAARLGGDEFAIVLHEADAVESAVRIAERITACLKEPVLIDDKVLFLGGSVGIATFPADAHNVSDLMKYADLALYSAKANCKGSWCRFNQQMLAGLVKRGALEADLREALARGQLEVFAQPIMKLDPDAIGGYEALMRWNHPVHGYIAPSTFIPIAEDIGLIRQIGDWVIQRACDLLCQLPVHQSVSVNVSSVQFRLPGLVENVTRSLARCGIPPRRLVLEITESVLMKDEDQVMRSLDRLRELGVQVALDDFGTGFASFAYLQKYSFDRIKIDRSFTSDLPGSAKSRAIVSAVSVLASQLDLTVTVEGVETPEQLAAVRQLGCHEAQGFLIGHPANADELFPPCTMPAHCAA
jgi:diguanylate cyclase (GGDEF)-like protein